MGMNPFYDQIKSLPDMYGAWNPMTYIQGQQQLDQANQFNQGTMRQQQQDISLADMMNPLKVRSQELSNQTAEAQLPGITAQSSMYEDKAKKSRATVDADIEAELGKFKGQVSQQHLDEIGRTAARYSQIGNLLKNIPGTPGSHARIRELLGKDYLPEFDQVSPKDLGAVIEMMGNEMSDSAVKYRQQLGLVQAKGDEAEQLAAVRERERRITEQQKAAAAASLAELKGKLAADAAKIKANAGPKTYQEAATNLLRQAQAETDSDRKAALLEQAQEYVNLQHAMEVAKGQQSQAGKVDVGSATGMPTNPQPTPPQVGGPSAGNNPILQDPNLAKLPQGTKALGNGIYQLPDGRKVKANK